MKLQFLPKYTAAVVQAAPEYLDLQGTVDKTIALIRAAAQQGARLIVFPECWIPGYPYWAWLDSPAWAARWTKPYAANALELGSDEERRIADAAAEYDIHVVLGCAERLGSSLFITQTIYDASGQRIAVRRKLKPTGTERAVFGDGGGADLLVCDSEIGRLGALSCWEHLAPLSAYALYQQGVQVHAASWPAFAMYRGVRQLSAEANDAVNLVHALTGGSFVLAATGVVTQAIIDQICETPAHRDLIWVGGGKSMIFGPDGSRLAEYVPPDREDLVFADLDFEHIVAAKALLDTTGHSASRNVTELVIHDHGRLPVPPLAKPINNHHGQLKTPDDAAAPAST